MEQVPLKDYIVYDIFELSEKCHKAYKDRNRLKGKTISSLVKEFLTSPQPTQSYIIALFLLQNDSDELNYIAYLLFDMLHGEFMSPRPNVYESVYMALHYKVQKKLKIALDEVERYTKKLINFNEDDISYEKRICLMKAPDYVKSKAMDKLKESGKQGGGDTSVKATQYLDGLLKIPFNNYRIEHIFKILTEISNNVLSLCQQIKHTCKTMKEPNCVDMLNVVNAINTENDKLTSHQLEYLIRRFTYYLNNIRNNCKINVLWDNFDTLLSSHIKCNHMINNIKKITNQNILYLNNNNPIVVRHVDPIKNKRVNISTPILRENIKIYIQECIDTFDREEITLNEIEEMLSGCQVDYTKITKTFYNKVSKIDTTFNNISKEWVDYKSDRKKFLINIDNILDDAIYGQHDAKMCIKRLIGQWINGELQGYIFGFKGPPGTGKTTLAKKGLSKCLKMGDEESRPFAFIALGGTSNGSTLEGHNYTYVGSTWGKIVDVIIECKCLNPIIFIDELDKVSRTEHGKEIIGILTHLTDCSQNNEFSDRYFSGIKLDLSKALFIFSYNDDTLIDPILHDRITEVAFNGPSHPDKLEIAKRHLIPDILTTVGFRKTDIIFSNEIISLIIEKYTYEAGVRKLKETLFEIIREINIRVIMGTDTYDIKNKPLTLTEDILSDIFSDKYEIITKKVSDKSHIGIMNGLYATTNGIGGLTCIQNFQIPLDRKLELVLTGRQGDTMKESVSCAKTVAWNMLTPARKKYYYDYWVKNGTTGFHLHCPSAGTPKDGPSAGGAMSIAILSVMTNKYIKNDIAMTGEIDLNGCICAIGGLSAKIRGAKMAGVSIVICPEENKRDLDTIKKKDPTLIDNTIRILTIKNIFEAVPYVFNEDRIDYINYTKAEYHIVIKIENDIHIQVTDFGIDGDNESVWKVIDRGFLNGEKNEDDEDDDNNDCECNGNDVYGIDSTIKGTCFKINNTSYGYYYILLTSNKNDKEISQHIHIYKKDLLYYKKSQDANNEE